jgi:8-oxo-dGTP diphosphatase
MPEFVIDIQEIKVAVDVVLFAKVDNATHILLVQRKYAPFKDAWALPGGFVEQNESLVNAAIREIKEETNIQTVPDLKLVNVFGEVDRDPRRRVISIAYTGTIDYLPTVAGSTDAAAAQWFKLDQLPELAFDHGEIISQAQAI